jgi:hypothetical protein
LLDDDNVDNWFLPSLIEDLLHAGKLLQANQVYSFKKLPVIGGDYSVDNLEPTNLSAHLEFIGLIHQQIKDLPDGTQMRIKLFD